MSRAAVIVLSLLALSACHFADELEKAREEAGAIEQDVRRDLGVGAHVGINWHNEVKDVSVHLENPPPGLTAQEVDRDLQLIVHKRMPTVNHLTWQIGASGPAPRPFEPRAK